MYQSQNWGCSDMRIAGQSQYLIFFVNISANTVHRMYATRSGLALRGNAVLICIRLEMLYNADISV